jgi:hypothetical protein
VESIIEALDIWREEKTKSAEHEATQKALGKEVIPIISSKFDHQF